MRDQIGPKVLNKLKRLALGPTDGAQTQKEPLPLPPSQTLGELPEIRIQAGELPNFSDSVKPRACMTCGPLQACTEQPVLKKDLLRSTGNGCSICGLLWEACRQIADIDHVDYVSTWTGRGGVFGLYLGRDDLENVAGESKAPGQAATVMFLASDGERTRSPFSWLPIVAKSPFSRSQSRDTQMLSSWVSDCQANHPSCQQILNPKLPTRVIDVGSGIAQPFLKVTHGEAGRYLALSHRWGNLDSQRKMLITKRENIDEFCQEIPFASFPLTFKHAIETSRSLGIQYLWIDSLCIIQDDINDWEIEATRMGDIYENAYATIFAERASHCDDGLFQTADDRANLTDWIREISYRDPQTNEQHWILVSWPSYYPNSLEEAFCLVDKSISQLQNRGWVMQEELLSRRKICFSKSELHWQCKSMSQCECGLRTLADIQGTNDFTRNILLTPRGDGSVTRGLSASNSTRTRKSTNLNKSWKKMVEMYTQREFTNERDRLPALAGAASKLGRPSQNYLAGIWREDAGDQLLWYGRNGKKSPCHRHEPYYAPTWSWASLRGRIFFSSFRGWCPMQIWRIMDGSCQPAGQNPMDLVSTSVLRIQSKVAPVFVEEREGPASKLEQNDLFDMIQQFGIYEQKRDGKTYHLALRADTGEGKEARFVSHDSIVFLDTEDDWKLFAGKKAQRCYYLIAHAGSNIRDPAISERVFRTMGLLIRESAVKQGYWERICLLMPQIWWGDWSHITEDREILLI